MFGRCFKTILRVTSCFYKESYEEPSLSEEEAHEKSSGVSEKHQTVLTTDQSATSADVALDMRNDETDSGKRAINLAQIPPNDLELKALLPDCPDLLSTKQPYHCSEKSTSLSLSKIVITSYSGYKIAQETESKKLIKENLKTYYQELVESLKVDKDNVHLLTGPTEQDWLQYFEQENQRKKKKRKGKKTKSNKSLEVFETSALNAMNDETNEHLFHERNQNPSYNQKSEIFEKAHSGRKVKTSTIRRLKERVQIDHEFKQKCFGSENPNEFLNPCCLFPQLGAQHRDAFVEALNKYGDDDTETLNMFGGNFNKGINYNESQGFEKCSFPGLGRYESNEFPSYDHEICEEYDYFDFVEDCEVGAEEDLLGRCYCTEPVQSWNCCCNF